jgi:hypothetical protein
MYTVGFIRIGETRQMIALEIDVRVEASVFSSLKYNASNKLYDYGHPSISVMNASFDTTVSEK